MLKECFEGITDTRQAWKVKHNLLEIIVMTICAVIAGCDVWEDIADLCRVKENWLRESLHLTLENGIPSHDTMQRVWGMIEPEEFEKRFCEWVEAVSHKVEGDIISVDGKTLRRSGEKGKSPIHMVSAWSNQQQMVLGQLATDEKSNEITAVPELLNILDISGCIITADAMSCQKEIVKRIRENGADYVIGLKENQPTLRNETEEYFTSALETPQFYPHVSKIVKHDQGHGRIETREYYLCTDPDYLKLHIEWKDLNSVGMMKSRIIQNEAETEETHYYISSLTDVNTFADAARSHWGVENSLHWCLDVTFREDSSRMRKDHSAENFAVVRHIVLNTLKNMPDKMSVARRRRHCAYDDAYLASVLRSIHA